MRAAQAELEVSAAGGRPEPHRSTVTQVRHPLRFLWRLSAGSEAASDHATLSGVVSSDEAAFPAPGPSVDADQQAAADVLCLRLQQYSRCLDQCFAMLLSRKQDDGCVRLLCAAVCTSLGVILLWLVLAELCVFLCLLHANLSVGGWVAVPLHPDSRYPALFWESPTHYFNRLDRHRSAVRRLVHDVFAPFPEEIAASRRRKLSTSTNSTRVAQLAHGQHDNDDANDNAVGQPAPASSSSSSSSTTTTTSTASTSAGPPTPAVEARGALHHAPLRYLTKFCNADTGHASPRRILFAAAVATPATASANGNGNAVAATSLAQLFVTDDACGVLSNAAINYSLVQNWLGKKTLLARWGHVTVPPRNPAASGSGSSIVWRADYPYLVC